MIHKNHPPFQNTCCTQSAGDGQHTNLNTRSNSAVIWVPAAPPLAEISSCAGEELSFERQPMFRGKRG